MPHEAAGLGIGPPPALALDYGESQRRIWTRRRVSEARRSTSAGSSRGRTILSWRRVCDDWVARLDRALVRCVIFVTVQNYEMAVVVFAIVCVLDSKGVSS